MAILNWICQWFIGVGCPANVREGDDGRDQFECVGFVLVAEGRGCFEIGVGSGPERNLQVG